MSRIVRGLPVTTTSRPDMVPLTKKDDDESGWNTGEQIPMEIVLGEFKNGPKCTSENCLAQVISYSQGLLHYLQIELGLPANEVYGFCVSGRRCSDQDFHTVSLVRSRVPMFLGKTMHVEHCTMEAASLDDMKPLQVLIHFLKSGK